MKIIPVVAGNNLRQRVIASACPAIDLLFETGIGKASERCTTDD